MNIEHARLVNGGVASSSDFQLADEPNKYEESACHLLCPCDPKLVFGCISIVFLVTISVAVAVSDPTAQLTHCNCTSPIEAPHALRLQKGWQPLSYSVFWGFARGLRGTLAGAVDIQIEPTRACPDRCEWVWLNAARSRLDIRRASLSFQDATHPVEVVWHPAAAIVGLRLPLRVVKEATKRHRITVHLEYESNITTGLDGIYISEWNSPAGSSVPLVVTQFEATAARNALPCFDEPAFKAVHC